MGRFFRYQLFVLLGALLLFGMEPLVGKLLLPSSGGGFVVWVTSLMFFQGALFVGYAYCHLLAERLGRAHLLLLLLALPFLPLGGSLIGLTVAERAPVTDILLGLTASVGVPFALLSTTGVISQHWLLRSGLPERRNPYQLFAISNAGSLIALLAYPLLAEPLLGLSQQRWAWSAAYLAYVLLAFSIAPRPGAAQPAAEPAAEPAASEVGDPPDPADVDAPPPPLIALEGWRALVFWCLLSAAPSIFLMAVTNRLAYSLGSLPFVWVLPLAVYLVTFMLAFARRPFYPVQFRRGWPLLLAVGLVHWASDDAPITPLALATHLLILFIVGVVGHGELYASRPEPKRLTAFYLAISCGGWLGGVFVALVAPRIFTAFHEYTVAILLLAATVTLLRRGELRAWLASASPRLRVASAGALVLCAALIVVVYVGRPVSGAQELHFRNDYGIYQVLTRETLEGGKPQVARYMMHGTTNHGYELMTTDADRGRPVGYYHPAAPMAQVMNARRRPARVGVVGLGAGVFAAFTEPGERLTFFELDPLVERLAREHFDFLTAPRGDVGVELGDARVTLQRVEDGALDLLVIDAFSGGAIPTHLLTREALTLYRQKLRPDGLLLFHISNNYYDLRAVLHATGGSLEPPYHGAYLRKLRREELAEHEHMSECYLLANDPRQLEPFLAQGWTAARAEALAPLTPWTDDYTNPLAALWARSGPGTR